MTSTRSTVASDGAPLAARLDLPDGRPLAFALLAHCFTGGKDQIATARLARGLTARGIGVLRLDLTGPGESGGELAESTVSTGVDDLVNAADRLRAEVAAPALLVGHSLGGAAVLAATARIPEVRAVATIGAPYSPDHVAHLFDTTRPEARPLLVLHSPTDEIVDVDNARRIVDAAASPASFVALDGADHLLTRAADADRVGALIAAWAAPYLDDPTGDDTTDDDTAADEIPPPEPGTVEVAETGVGRFTQRVRTTSHEWSADEPPSAGGTDTAPDPYQLLLSALGACTAMTLRMYADRKGWDLRRSTVTLTHARLHATDCTTCETSSGLLDRIVREIHLEGDLDDAQRAKLLAIAERCPVHRTLQAEIVIETDLV